MAQGKVVTVRMSREEHDAFKIFSFHSGISINEVMLRAMRNFLATEGKSKEFDEVLRTTRTRYRSALDKFEDR